MVVRQWLRWAPWAPWVGGWVDRQLRGRSLDRAQKSPAAASPVDIPDGPLVGGSVPPVKVGNEGIGVVGIGAKPGGHRDERCAMAALGKVKDTLK